MMKPTARRTAKTTNPVPSVIQPTIGSTCRVILYAARICPVRLVFGVFSAFAAFAAFASLPAMVGRIRGEAPSGRTAWMRRRPAQGGELLRAGNTLLPGEAESARGLPGV